MFLPSLYLGAQIYRMTVSIAKSQVIVSSNYGTEDIIPAFRLTDIRLIVAYLRYVSPIHLEFFVVEYSEH